MPEDTRNKYKKIFPFYIITGSTDFRSKYPNILEQKDSPGYEKLPVSRSR